MSYAEQSLQKLIWAKSPYTEMFRDLQRGYRKSIVVDEVNQCWMSG